MNEFPLITTLTVAPLIGAIALLTLEARKKNLARRLALGFSLIALVLTGLLWKQFDPASSELQFVEPQLSCLLLKSGHAAISPNLNSVAHSPKVEPSIIIVIDRD